MSLLSTTIEAHAVAKNWTLKKKGCGYHINDQAVLYPASSPGLWLLGEIGRGRPWTDCSCWRW